MTENTVFMVEVRPELTRSQRWPGLDHRQELDSFCQALAECSDLRLRAALWREYLAQDLPVINRAGQWTWHDPTTGLELFHQVRGPARWASGQPRFYLRGHSLSLQHWCEILNLRQEDRLWMQLKWPDQ